MKKSFWFLILGVLLAVVVAGCAKSVSTNQQAAIGGSIRIIDDSRKEIILAKPATKIISMYSAHTENLFSLGLDKEIIGVSSSETYPSEVKNKKVFDYRGDPEKILAEEPDIVIIRPLIRKSYPEFVKTLENAGVVVVSLYPEKFDQFDDYITKLAILTGKQETAKVKLADFHNKLNDLQAATAKLSNKKRVYFESTETDYRTITTDSMTARLLAIAGGINVASDVVPIQKGSSIAGYGAERLLSKGEEIDVFFAQSGIMNPGDKPEAIKNRIGFDKIKAVQQDTVYNIDEKLVSSPTFRLVNGAYQIAQTLYPELLVKK